MLEGSVDWSPFQKSDDAEGRFETAAFQLERGNQNTHTNIHTYISQENYEGKQSSTVSLCSSGVRYNASRLVLWSVRQQQQHSPALHDKPVMVFRAMELTMFEAVPMILCPWCSPKGSWGSIHGDASRSFFDAPPPTPLKPY